MALYAQVKDGLVKHVWDSAPPVPVGGDGWMDAVENIPQLTSRQEYGNFTYDTSVDPAIISREVIDIPFEDMKKRLLDNNVNEYKNFLDQLTKTPTAFNQELIDSNRLNAKRNKDAITSATTYEELESLVLVPITLF